MQEEGLSDLNVDSSLNPSVTLVDPLPPPEPMLADSPSPLPPLKTRPKPKPKQKAAPPSLPLPLPLTHHSVRTLRAPAVPLPLPLTHHSARTLRAGQGFHSLGFGREQTIVNYRWVEKRELG